jgi:hypothetical protein
MTSGCFLGLSHSLFGIFGTPAHVGTAFHRNFPVSVLYPHGRYSGVMFTSFPQRLFFVSQLGVVCPGPHQRHPWH